MIKALKIKGVLNKIETRIPQVPIRIFYVYSLESIILQRFTATFQFCRGFSSISYVKVCMSCVDLTCLQHLYFFSLPFLKKLL